MYDFKIILKNMSQSRRGYPTWKPWIGKDRKEKEKEEHIVSMILSLTLSLAFPAYHLAYCSQNGPEDC